VESLSLLDIVSYSLVPFPEEEEKPVKRRGRPRKVRDVPDVANVRNVRGKKLFKDDGHNSSGEESISASDHQGHGEDNDSDDDTDQPLINTIRSSAAKLRSVADPGFESRVCLTNKFNMSVYTIQQHSYKTLQKFAIQNRIEHRPKYYGHTMTN